MSQNYNKSSNNFKYYTSCNNYMSYNNYKSHNYNKSHNYYMSYKFYNLVILTVLILQTSLFSSMGFEILSGLFFLWTTLYVISDRLKAEEEEKRLTTGKGLRDRP